MGTINNRKGKLIYFYDWSVKLEYTGSLPGSESEHTGTIEVPNLSDENDADDLDIQVLSKSDANNARKLKDLVRKTGREPMRGLCMKYVTDMKTEYSSGMVLPTKNVNNTSKVKETTSKQAPNEQMKNVKLTDNNKHKNIVHVELKLTEEFKTTADLCIYEMSSGRRCNSWREVLYHGWKHHGRVRGIGERQEDRPKMEIQRVAARCLFDSNDEPHSEIRLYNIKPHPNGSPRLRYGPHGDRLASALLGTNQTGVRFRSSTLLMPDPGTVYSKLRTMVEVQHSSCRGGDKVVPRPQMQHSVQ